MEPHPGPYPKFVGRLEKYASKPYRFAVTLRYTYQNVDVAWLEGGHVEPVMQAQPPLAADEEDKGVWVLVYGLQALVVLTT
jgi:hypothetical protein